MAKYKFYQDLKIKVWQRNTFVVEGSSKEEAIEKAKIATKTDGTLMVRECVYRDKLTKPLTCKMLDASREYWIGHGVTDWGIVIDKASGEAK